jgi:hypothetical protein
MYEIESIVLGPGGRFPIRCANGLPIDTTNAMPTNATPIDSPTNDRTIAAIMLRVMRRPGIYYDHDR